jgi:hypothetical protein
VLLWCWALLSVPAEPAETYERSSAWASLWLESLIQLSLVTNARHSLTLMLNANELGLNVSVRYLRWRSISAIAYYLLLLLSFRLRIVSAVFEYARKYLPKQDCKHVNSCWFIFSVVKSLTQLLKHSILLSFRYKFRNFFEINIHLEIKLKYLLLW